MKQVKRENVFAVVILALLTALVSVSKPPAPSPTVTPSATVRPKWTVTAGPTRTATRLPFTPTHAMPTLTGTPGTVTVTPRPTVLPPNTGSNPFPSAPACVTHDHSIWHGLWNGTDRCHYDHEHGQNPFTSAVAAAFAPLGDLRTLLGGVEVGHTNPSAPAENEHKHGGMKWNAVPQTPQGCVIGFESATVCVTAAVIQWHTWGNLAEELEADVHSSVFMIRQGASDYGYIYGVQFQEYGENCAPYQGFTLPYPQNFSPEWDCAFGQYWSVPCVFDGLPDCNLTGPSGMRSANRDASAIVTSKITGPNSAGRRPQGSLLFNLLFRVRDNYQVLDSHDLVHPFTWLYICSSDGGRTYDPRGCRYNNSTATVHEVAGTIPASWDGLIVDGVLIDTDGRAGRVSFDGFVTKFGALNLGCTVADVELDCFPLKLVNAFVGKWGGELSAEKVSNDTPLNTRENDIYFCSGVPCSETSPGAVPSGWISNGN
jgi:hypothetical protein